MEKEKKGHNSSRIPLRLIYYVACLCQGHSVAEGVSVGYPPERKGTRAALGSRFHSSDQQSL